jgi:hypothetical protein
MRLKGHPPLAVAAVDPGRAQGPGCGLLHAAVWLVIDLEEWGVRREGHLHLVRPVEGGPWRSVDLARHPLRRLPDEEASGWASPAIAEELLRWLRGGPLRFFRIPSLEAVSELGESEAAFRSRILGYLAPEVTRRIGAARAAETPGRWPWGRRRRTEARQRRDDESMASQVAALAGRVETLAAEDRHVAVRSIEVGLLFVPPGCELRPSERVMPSNS